VLAILTDPFVDRHCRFATPLERANRRTPAVSINALNLIFQDLSRRLWQSDDAGSGGTTFY
jgi:hypothetical protein